MIRPPERPVRRRPAGGVGIAVLTVAATALMLTGAAIVFLSVIGGDAVMSNNRQEQLAAVARDPALWRLVCGLWVAGSVVLIAALAAAAPRLAAAHKRGIGRAGEAVFSLGLLLWMGVALLRASAWPWLAERAAGGSELMLLWDALAALERWMVTLFEMLAFTGLGILGLAARGGPRTGLGAVLALVGAGGAALAAVGASIPALPFATSLILGVGLAVVPADDDAT